MKTAERTTAPALGNAIGYFAAYYAISQFDWLMGVDESIATAMMGTIFIHLLIELRGLFSWVKGKVDDRRQSDAP